MSSDPRHYQDTLTSHHIAEILDVPVHRVVHALASVRPVGGKEGELPQYRHDAVKHVRDAIAKSK